MELPVSGLDAFLEWQERLKRFESSGLSVDAFCRQEDVVRTQFSQWLLAVRGKSLRDVEGERKTVSRKGPAFVPLAVKTQFIEILLPGGGMVRLSAGVDRTLLMDVIQIISTVLQEAKS